MASFTCAALSSCGSTAAANRFARLGAPTSAAPLRIRQPLRGLSSAHGLSALPSVSPSSTQLAGAPRRPQRGSVTARAEQQQQQPGSAATGGEGERQVVYNKEFGYSRKDVLIIIVGLIGLGVVMYEGLQAGGMDAGMAGNVVQATIFLGICVGWVSTYLWRVANKKMTYARQLEMYEAAVMQKRLEEMTEAELSQLLAEVESDRARLQTQKELLSRRQAKQ